MKHCPNPECLGFDNIGIVSEFNDTASVCSDCGASLVDGPAPAAPDRPAPDPDLVLVPVLSVIRESDLVFVESLLMDAQIPYLARGEQIQDLFGFGRIVGVNPITEPVEILVSQDDVDDARAVLAGFMADQDAPSRQETPSE